MSVRCAMRNGLAVGRPGAEAPGFAAAWTAFAASKPAPPIAPARMMSRLVGFTSRLLHALPAVVDVAVVEGAARVEVEDAVTFLEILVRPAPPVAAHGAVADEADAQVVDAIDQVRVPGDAELDV